MGSVEARRSQPNNAKGSQLVKVGGPTERAIAPSPVPIIIAKFLAKCTCRVRFFPVLHRHVPVDLYKASTAWIWLLGSGCSDLAGGGLTPDSWTNGQVPPCNETNCLASHAEDRRTTVSCDETKQGLAVLCLYSSLHYPFVTG